MDDYKLLISMGSTLASLAGAFAVVRYQVKAIMTTLQDVEQRLRKMDTRGDKLTTLTETQEQRIDILAKMSSPENLRRDHMNLAEIMAQVGQLRKEMDHQLHIHNSKHIPVPDVRKAE